MAHPIIEWLKREISKNPEIMKIIEEESGPYGPAIKEKGWELIRPKPREEGEEYPFFPPGIFSPYPKAFDDQENGREATTLAMAGEAKRGWFGEGLRGKGSISLSTGFWGHHHRWKRTDVKSVLFILGKCEQNERCGDVRHAFGEV